MIELYIDNKLVELSDSIDYSLTKSFFDLSDPSKLCDDWSKTIKIPMTENNKKLFGQCQIPNRATTGGNSQTGIEFSPYVKVGYSLYENGSRIMEGHIKMNKTVYSQKDKNFEVTLYGNWNESLHQLQLISSPDEDNDVLEKVYVNNTDFQISKLTTNVSNSNLSRLDNSYRVFPNTVGNYYPDFNSDECLNLQDKKKYSYDRELPILSTKEFRIDKLPLYKSVQSIFGEISKYTKNFILDPLFFSKQNPYYAKTWWQVSSPFMNYSSESIEKIDTSDRMKFISSSVTPVKESGTASTAPAKVGIPVYNNGEMALLFTVDNLFNPKMFECAYKQSGVYGVGANKIELAISNINGQYGIRFFTRGYGDRRGTNVALTYSLTSGTSIRIVVNAQQVINNVREIKEQKVSYVLCMEGDESNCNIDNNDVVVTLKPATVHFDFYDTGEIQDDVWYAQYRANPQKIVFESNDIEAIEHLWMLNAIGVNPDHTDITVDIQIRKGNNGYGGAFIDFDEAHPQGLPFVPQFHSIIKAPVENTIPAGSISVNLTNDFYLNKSAKVENLFGNLNYFDFLCNYAKMFNLKLLTKDGYNILTNNNRLLGYDINLDEYPIDYNEEYAGVKIDYSSIEYSPIWLESTYLELTYAENDLSFGKKFLDENNKQYGAFVKKSWNEFAVERTPIYESPLMPSITVDVNSLDYPQYKWKSDNADDGLILDGSANGMTPMRVINMGNTDGETITDGMSMVFESENSFTIPHSLWSVSTPEMINNQDYCYYRKISEVNDNIAKKFLMKDTYTFYNWANNAISITSRFAKEEYQGNSLLFTPTATKYYVNPPLREYGLKERFHSYLDDLYSYDSRTMKCKAIVDMSKFKWYHLMVIDGCNWLVTKINNWKNSESLCDLELVKVEDIDKYKSYAYGFDQFDLQRQNVLGKANEEFMVVCSHDANDTGIDVSSNADKITLVEQTQLFNDLCVYKFKINADATEDYTIVIDSDSGETTYIDVKKV